MKLSGVTKMVKRQLVCNVFHNVASDDFYIGTASAIYCATGFPLPLNRNQMGALLGISEDTMIEKVVYNDFDCAHKSDLEGFNLDDNVKNEVEVKKMAVGIYYMGETLIPLATEDKKMAGLICWSQLAPVEDEIKNNGFIRFFQRKLGNGRTYFVVKKRYASTSSCNVILAERVCGSNTARAGGYAGRNAYWRTGRERLDVRRFAERSGERRKQ